MKYHIAYLFVRTIYKLNELNDLTVKDFILFFFSGGKNM